MADYTYRPRRTLVIEIDIQSAMGDDRLFTKVLDSLRSEGDVVFFGVTRAVAKAKRTKDVTEVSSMRIDWKP
jgi:hypothetical protein